MPFAAAAGGLVLLGVAAPAYLRSQGFPLDDAWIHAVYARELARSGMLAYNPGVAATGETAPLWALLMAIAHRVGRAAPSAVALTKAIGFLLHALTAALAAHLLRSPERRVDWLAGAAGALVSLHPDLVSASVSGMEVPLATLVIIAMTLAVVRARLAAVAALGAVAIAARPEAAAYGVVVPLLYWARRSPRTAVQLSAAAGVGAVAALVLLGLRNHAVSGLLLPATFYAKANVHAPIDFGWQRLGFAGLLALLPLGGPFAVVAVFAAASLALLAAEHTSDLGRTAAAMYVGGLAFCAVSFSLVPPLDPAAFYHQRYVLPALAPMVAAMPILVGETLGAMAPRVSPIAQAAAVVVMAATLVIASPTRYRRLSNDARNIDDVQVAMGRALASAAADQTAWVVDAGASRFFGRAFVVDLIGLNTPELLSSSAQTFLDAHPPKYLDVFPGWSALDASTAAAVPARSFVTTTAYTVTSFPAMQRHTLATCEPPGLTGRLRVRVRELSFRCAP